MSNGGRIPYAEAGALTRDVLRRGNRHLVAKQLTPADLRTLIAVVMLTGTYSRRGARVYLAQIAAEAYGIEHAEPWMLEKVRKSLVALAALGLVDRRAPRGRPPGDRDDNPGPSYWVAMAAEKQPGAGLDSDREMQPGPSRKSSPAPAGKAARPQPKKQPGAGGPTEKSLEEELLEETSENPATVRDINTAGGRLARTVTGATTAASPLATPTEAQHAVDLLLEHTDPATVGLALEEAIESTPDDRTAGQVLYHAARYLDPTTCAHIYDDPRAIALADQPAHYLAELVANQRGTRWTDHATEAVELLDRWREHTIPDDLIEAVLLDAAGQPLRRPWDADRLMRHNLPDTHPYHELPKRPPTPARKVAAR